MRINTKRLVNLNGLLSIITLLTLIITFINVGNAKASTKPPVCMSGSNYTYFDCTTLPNSTFPEGEAKPDKCYLVNGAAVDGQFIGSAQERACAELDRLRHENSTAVETECKELNQDKCGIVRYLVQFTNVLSGLVGIVIVIMIIVGGIQYSSAGDNPQKVSDARKKIYNALLALLAFIFMFAFLQWVVPGGIF